MREGPPQAPEASAGSKGPTKSERTRRQLLDAAAAALSDKGYSRTRLSDIVASLHIHPASIYYHFESKDAVVQEVLSVAMTTSMSFIRDVADALPQNARAIDRMAASVHAHMYIILEMSAYVGAALRVLGEVPETIHEQFVKDHRLYSAYWDELLRDARQEGELRPEVNILVLRPLLLNAMGGRIEWYTAGGRISASAVADEIVRTFIGGMVEPAWRDHVQGEPLRRTCLDAVGRIAARHRAQRYDGQRATARETKIGGTATRGRGHSLIEK
jgi:AcrR family transcriptional regulator